MSTAAATSQLEYHPNITCAPRPLTLRKFNLVHAKMRVGAFQYSSQRTNSQLTVFEYFGHVKFVICLCNYQGYLY